MAVIIAIEGIDGSGKGTQAGRLHARCQAEGIKSSLIGFPRYDQTLFGKSIGDFLNGRFGELDEVNPFLASLLYAGDRFESRSHILNTIETSDVVIFDRYIPSNVAHQGAKLSGAERNEFIEWIEQIEFAIYKMPRLDLAILLDLPADYAQKLVAEKQARSYTEKVTDLQEADQSYLANVREVYLQLAEENQHWQKIECLQNETLRSIEEIGDEIWSHVGKLI
ncbi:nucleoside/nucleotide kinase family protein [Gimesia algae]|uniref:Thymidylate kinase n=1 Tax=Gimesia algae TaxID=2527971 RepID=A0A517VN40_9PLAN|nr:thymidylate kinase [Gimesia algae]QDT94437.1 Thymidylate kinase [Gimesia algae]